MGAGDIARDLELLDAELVGFDAGLDAAALAAAAAKEAAAAAAPAASAPKALTHGIVPPSPGAAGRATADAATQAALAAARAPAKPSGPSAGQKVLSFLEQASEKFAGFFSKKEEPALAPAPAPFEEPGWLDGQTGPVPNKVIAGVAAAGAVGLAVRALVAR